MPQITLDTFNATSGNLEAHTGEQGATWAKHPAAPSAASMVLTSNRRVRTNQAGAKENLYIASGVPAGAEYDVAFDLFVNGALGAGWDVGALARLDPTAETYYYGCYSKGSNRWQLNKCVAGTNTVLGFSNATVTVSTTYSLKLQVYDAEKALWVNGTKLITSADNAVTGAGRPGVRGFGALDDFTGGHLDNYSATDLVTGLVLPTLTLLGVGS